MAVDVERWVAEALDSEPIAKIFAARHLSEVVGYELADGRKVVVKARPGVERAARCVAAQRALFLDGFPCPEPLTDVAEIGRLAVHAESYIEAEQRRLGADPGTVDVFASVFADLLTRLDRLHVEPPQGPPMWLAWDHAEPGVWPHSGVDYPDGRVDPPAWLTDVACRVRDRMSSIELPQVVGHADWETQHLRWDDERLLVVHDWDSLALRAEAALVGAAAATFPSDREPVLAPLAASERFLQTYQQRRGRAFSDVEISVAWGAGLWLAAHNARMELIYRRPPLVHDALAEQAETRLRRAVA